MKTKTLLPAAFLSPALIILAVLLPYIALLTSLGGAG